MQTVKDRVEILKSVDYDLSQIQFRDELGSLYIYNGAICIFDQDYTIESKPKPKKRVTIEIPEPMTEHPLEGERYWFICNGEALYRFWRYEPLDRRLFSSGIWGNAEDVREVLEAIQRGVLCQS